MFQRLGRELTELYLLSLGLGFPFWLYIVVEIDYEIAA